jgi:hypothetical protein
MYDRACLEYVRTCLWNLTPPYALQLQNRHPLALSHTIVQSTTFGTAHSIRLNVTETITIPATTILDVPARLRLETLSPANFLPVIVP